MADSSSKKAAPAKKKATAKKAVVTRRIGSEQAESRILILNLTEKLMLDEGYGAVTTRRVAKEADIRPSLVHYYFPTTDDLFLALYRRTVDEEIERQDQLQSKKSLKKYWSSYHNKNRTALAMEFMALGNHRKAIKQEIAAYTESTRKRRAEALAEMINMKSIEPVGCSAAGLSVLLISVARTLVIEEGLGISYGHKDAKAFVEYWLERLEISHV